MCVWDVTQRERERERERLVLVRLLSNKDYVSILYCPFAFQTVPTSFQNILLHSFFISISISSIRISTKVRYVYK